jgi:hypothetical protein
MITTDCPLCGTDAQVDATLTVVDCDACGTLEIAPDPALVLDAAA